MGSETVVTERSMNVAVGEARKEDRENSVLIGELEVCDGSCM